jgi:hypothetical protein
MNTHGRYNMTVLAIILQQKDGIIQEHKPGEYSSNWKPMWYSQYTDRASEWLLFNDKWGIFQLYHDENKLHSRHIILITSQPVFDLST